MTIQYQQILQSLDHIVDRLGKPIDQKIKPIVAALRLHQFNTIASCEGHLFRALPYPWVDICDGVNKNDIQSNQVYKSKLLKLLNKCSDKGLISKELTIEMIGIYGGFRLQNKNNAEKNSETLRRLQDDMNNFANWLINV